MHVYPSDNFIIKVIPDDHTRNITPAHTNVPHSCRATSLFKHYKKINE
jgi:hypothetical protein